MMYGCTEDASFIFNQLQQHTSSGGRVDEDVAVAAGAGLGFVEQARASGAEACNGCGEIRDAQSDMVQAFAATGEKTADDGIGIGWFEQLDARSADGQHGDVGRNVVAAVNSGVATLTVVSAGTQAANVHAAAPTPRRQSPSQAQFSVAAGVATLSPAAVAE